MPNDQVLSTRLREALPIFSALAMALLGLIIVAALYAGRDVFVPLAVAVILSFVLAPLVRLLQQVHLPRGLATAAVVGLAFAAIFGLATVMAGQAAQLAADLPRYELTMRQKIQSVRGAASEVGPFGRAADILQKLGRELESPRAIDSGTGPVAPGGVRSGEPATAERSSAIPVEVRDPDAGPLQTISTLVGPLLHPLATTGLTVVFVIFILLQREDLRNRFIRLAGAADLQKTTAAIDDAAHRLSRLFLTQLALNTGFGIIIFMGLTIIGVPSAALWGILAGVLRFVPYIGAFLGAAFPLALAAAVDPGWSLLIWTALLFLAVEPIIGHVLEPVLYGHSTGLSPVAVVVSATFWTVLWGPVGLVLAAPLTVCLVVLGRHIERLRFIDVLLGDRPALSPQQIFYQRMLAGDPVEAVAQAEEFLKERSLLLYYDEVALEGLRLAVDDAQRGALDEQRLLTIRDSVRDLVSELAAARDDAELSDGDRGERISSPEAAAAVEAVGPDPAVARVVLSKADLPSDWQGGAPVLCLAGRDILDEGAALMLAQVLGNHGLNATVLDRPAASRTELIHESPVALACLSFMDAPSIAHIRYAVRRVRRKLPGVRVLVGIWRGRDPAIVEELCRQTSADYLVTSLREAIQVITRAATQRTPTPRAAALEAVPQMAAGLS